MNRQLRGDGSHFVRRAIGALPALALALSVAGLHAQTTTGSFTFKLDQMQTTLSNENNLAMLEYAIEEDLVDPNNPEVQAALLRAKAQMQTNDAMAACTLVPTAKHLRTQPAFSIGNALNSSGTRNLADTLHIIGMTISIVDNLNIYDFVDHQTSHTAAMPIFVPSNTEALTSLENSGDSVAIAFANGGLHPGQMATLQLQLGLDSPGPNDAMPRMEDFFSEDSFVTVTFQDPVTLNTYTTDPFKFLDYNVTTSALFTQINGGTHHVNGVVDSFAREGSYVVGAIPEPSAFVLALGSLAGLWRLRRRRSAPSR